MDREPLKTIQVFISYSRSDTAVVDEIVAGLEYDGGFRVAIDRDDIQEGEEWKSRIRNLITNSDTVLYILSKKSAKSEVVRWELEYALGLSKRILPVQIETLEGINSPYELSSLNYVRFDPEDDGRPRSFIGGLSSIRRALKTDLEWVREHTRLLTRAHEWHSAGRPENRLLFGRDIIEAKTWLERHPESDVEPTELHRDFIAESERAEATKLSDERKRSEALYRAVVRIRYALGGALALFIIASTLGWMAYQNQQHANQNAVVAIANEARALAALSNEALSSGDKRRAIALAMLALTDPTSKKEKRLVPQAWAALISAAAPPIKLGHYTGITEKRDNTLRTHTSLSSLNDFAITGTGLGSVKIWQPSDNGRIRQVLSENLGLVFHTAVSPNSSVIAASSNLEWSSSRLYLWNSVTGATIKVIDIPKVVVGIFFLDDETLLTVQTDGKISTWSSTDGQGQESFLVVPNRDWDDSVFSSSMSADRGRLALGTSQGNVELIDVRSKRLVRKIRQGTGTIFSLSFHPSGSHLATGNKDGSIRIHNLKKPYSGQVLLGHEAFVWDVRYTPSGNSIVSISEDGSVRIWSIAHRFPLWVNRDPVYNHYNLAIRGEREKILLITDGTVVWEIDLRAFEDLSWLIESGRSILAESPALSFFECQRLRLKDERLCEPYMPYSR